MEGMEILFPMKKTDRILYKNSKASFTEATAALRKQKVGQITMNRYKETA